MAVKMLPDCLLAVAVSRCHLLLLLAVLSVGCSTLPIYANYETGSSSDGSLLEEVPFSLKIHDEINDGSALHVRAGIVSEVEWDAREMIVRFTALDEGIIENTSFFRLSDLAEEAGAMEVSGRIVPGSEFVFSLSSPSRSITDYQLEVLWGSEARELLALPTREKVFRLELRNLRVTPITSTCPRPPCPQSFQIDGEFYNAGGVVVSSATLGVGFVWNNEKETATAARVPENEEQIEVKSLSLAPGETREVRLVLDREVPQIAGGEYRPVVRVLEVS